MTPHAVTSLKVKPGFNNQKQWASTAVCRQNSHTLLHAGLIKNVTMIPEIFNAWMFQTKIV